MKKICVFLILAIAVSIAGQNSVQAKVIVGTACQAKGEQTTVSNRLYTCIKTGKKLVWNKGVQVKAKAPTPTPTPTSVGNIAITPVFTMVPRKTQGYVEISLPSIAAFSSGSEYFVVIDKNNVSGRRCWSGDVVLPLDRRTERKNDSVLFTLLPRGPKGSTGGIVFKVPSLPITFRCDYYDMTDYSLYLLETSNLGKTIQGKSLRFNFTTPQINEKVPTPTPSISAGPTAVLDALCGPENAKAQSSTGVTLTCVKSPTDGLLRWTT